ncbi:MAG: hypothetical protein KUG77_09040, partial [Nannocystaceae bacterium]|nr:hypothetical protein [Nannocystaceae bacterium]
GGYGRATSLEYGTDQTTHAPVVVLWWRDEPDCAEDVPRRAVERRVFRKPWRLFVHGHAF